MIDLNQALSICGELVTLATAFSLIISRFNQLQREITALRYHLESHCQMLQHISSHLESVSDYQPINKTPLS